jgi:hypothetical protein
VLPGQKSSKSRTDIETKSEVDMQDMSFRINHDVAIMAILKLKKIRHDRICRHALDEIVASLSQ